MAERSTRAAAIAAIVTVLVGLAAIAGWLSGTGLLGQNPDPEIGQGGEATPSANSRWNIPPAFADEGYGFSDLEHYFGGAWVREVSFEVDCDLTQRPCYTVEVATEKPCDQGFAIEVDFFDDFGDRVASERERVMGVGPDAATEIQVLADYGSGATSALVDRAYCI